MSFITYKILTDPHTFESLVMEMTVPELGDNIPLGKKRISVKEVEVKWTKEQFISELSKYGYGYAAQNYIKEKNIFNYEIK